MTSKNKKKPSSNEGRDWSSLPKLPLFIISSHLDAISHVYFRSTCSTWHTFSPRPKLPLIILANHTNLKRYASMAFFDIDYNLLFYLPKCSFEFGSYFCGSSHGYLVFLDPASKLYLINPITGHQIKLPKHNARYRKKKKFRGVHFQMKVALSASPTDPECIFAAISRSQNQVDVCTLTSTSWKTLFSLDDQDEFQDIIFYKGYFYLCVGIELYQLDLEANGGSGMVVQVPLDIFVSSDETDETDETDESDDDDSPWRSYLVEISGDLVMVFMYVSGDEFYYEFFKVDFEKKGLEMIELGVEDLMFLGVSLGIGTTATSYRECRNDSMLLTKLIKFSEEPPVFNAECSDIKYFLKNWYGIDQWDTLGWLIPNFLV
ncbi:F-box domain-containing protein [Dioscorea alata]|uniref:F-box domain-containing protein n=1 Tax=Dioscorea alata TaxID=55571 RepID=A0ACB7URI2_DIOAL|nr:F-box domain-containing protein [Dioscorea alata]